MNFSWYTIYKIVKFYSYYDGKSTVFTNISGCIYIFIYIFYFIYFFFGGGGGGVDKSLCPDLSPNCLQRPSADDKICC